MSAARVRAALASVGLDPELINRFECDGPPSGPLFGHDFACLWDALVGLGVPDTIARKLAWESFRDPPKEAK